MEKEDERKELRGYKYPAEQKRELMAHEKEKCDKNQVAHLSLSHSPLINLSIYSDLIKHKSARH